MGSDLRSLPQKIKIIGSDLDQILDQDHLSIVGQLKFLNYVSV